MLSLLISVLRSLATLLLFIYSTQLNTILGDKKKLFAVYSLMADISANKPETMKKLAKILEVSTSFDEAVTMMTRYVFILPLFQNVFAVNIIQLGIGGQVNAKR